MIILASDKQQQKKWFPKFFIFPKFVILYSTSSLFACCLVHAKNSYKKMKDAYVDKYMSFPMIHWFFLLHILFNS